MPSFSNIRQRQRGKWGRGDGNGEKVEDVHASDYSQVESWAQFFALECPKII